MRELLLFLLVTCATSGINNVSAQNTGRLVLTDVSIIQSEWHSAIISPARCDTDGNLYVRQFLSGTSNNVVTIINRKGDRVAKTSLDSNPDVKKGKLSDFGVGPDGELSELVHVDRSVYLVNFKHDGSLAGATKLEREFWPAKLAIGEASGSLFLVSGTEFPQTGKPPEVFNGLFDASGKLVREVKFSHDPGQIEAEPTKSAHQENYFEDEASFPLQLGLAETDLNGNFYVIRASEPPVAFVVNASGKFVRRLEIKAPEPGMRLLAAHVNAGRLAALLAQTSPDGDVLRETMVVTDTSTGNTLQQYVVPEEIGSAFACYSGNDFAFITTKDKKLAIQHARPE